MACAVLSFSKKSTKWADINTINGVVWSDSWGLISEVVKSELPKLSGIVAQVENERPSVKYFVEFLLTLARCGFQGVECSQDLICFAVRRVAHAQAFGERTLRNAAARLVELGLIDASWVPIGKRVQVAGGEWRTAQVRRYTLTARLKSLCACFARDVVQGRLKTHKKRLFNTAEMISANPSGELTQGRCLDDLPCVKLLQTVENKTGGEIIETARSTENEDKPTCAPRVDAAAHVEHGALKNAPAARKAAKKGGLRDSVSYSRARATFLAELFALLKPNGFDRVYCAAEVTTDQRYPDKLPHVLNVDELLRWYFLSWADRRKILKRSWVPAFESFARDWLEPADTVQAASFDLWAESLRPGGVSFERWRFLRPCLSALFAGRTDIDHTISTLIRLSC